MNLNAKTTLIRQLVPKSYHFDGYSKVNCPNSRDTPFFSDNVIPMGDHYLSTRLVSSDEISIEFDSCCNFGIITFKALKLTINEFAKKLQEATKAGRDYITLEIIPMYDNPSKCKNEYCSVKNSDCNYLLTNRPKSIYAAVSFNFSEMKEALEVYFEITNTTTNGGKTTMAKRKNNFMGMHFEFGLAKDPNISSTLMGVAVRNPSTGNWYTFDPATFTRKNIANFKMGDFPVCYLPSNQYVPGKLYKIDGKYYVVQSVNPNGTITISDAADGMVREYIPEQNLITGINIVTEVIAFDANTMMNPASKENVGGNILAAILMMQWAKGDNEAEFSLDNITDDSFNGLGSYLPLLMATGNLGSLGNMFGGTDGSPNLAVLMALGSDGSDSSGITQALLLNQLFGNSGNNPANNTGNPFSNLFQNVQPQAGSATAETEKTVCEKCGITYKGDDILFCPKCGGKTKRVSKACKKCGATLIEGADFCHKCGAKVGDATCTKCGSTLAEGALFCYKCGTAVNTESTLPENVSVPTKVTIEAEEKKSD